MNRTGPAGTRRATPAWVDWSAERRRPEFRPGELIPVLPQQPPPNAVVQIWIIAFGVTLGILAGGLATDWLLVNGWWPIALEVSFPSEFADPSAYSA